jgi:hypothetical protein
MTVSIDVAVGERTGRVFARTNDEATQAVNRLHSDFLDESDRAREPHLRALIDGGVVASAHPTVGLDDVVHVYLHPLEGGAPLFACVLVSRTRLDVMLREAPAVLEGFALQVVDAPHLTAESSDAIHVGVRAWVDRIFRGMQPMILVQPWRDAIETVEHPGATRGMPQRFTEPALQIGARRAPRVNEDEAA